MRRTLLVLFVISAIGCAGQKPIQTLQVTHSALATAQDLEAQLCWGVANVRLAPSDRTHCTSSIATTVGLTDARHQAINRGLVTAFNLDTAAAQQIASGAKSVDLTSLNIVLLEVLKLVNELSMSNSTVTQFQAILKSAQVVK